MENKSECAGIGAWAIMNHTAYIQIPKTLMECAPIIGVDLAAVLCYSMMIDRAKLSAENGLFDDMGRVYIYFTRKELCDITGWSRKKASDVYATLQSVGLIEEKIMKNRAGCNTKTRIFVRAWDVMVTDIWRREVHVEEFPFLDKDSIKIQQNFYVLPRDLLQRKNLNTKAKLLYAIALDLVALSETNGWRDDIGIWAELDAKKLQALLQCGHSSLSAAYQALQEADLIYRQKRECGMPMRTYLCSLKASSEMPTKDFAIAENAHQLSANQTTKHPKIAPQSCECAHQTILIDPPLSSLPYGVSLTGDAAKGGIMIEALDEEKIMTDVRRLCEENEEEVPAVVRAVIDTVRSDLLSTAPVVWIAGERVDRQSLMAAYSDITYYMLVTVICNTVRRWRAVRKKTSYLRSVLYRARDECAGAAYYTQVRLEGEDKFPILVPS